MCTSANITSTQCVSYCKSNNCDKPMSDYCAANPTNFNECGCINFPKAIQDTMSKLSSQGLAILPTCMVKACANNAMAFRPSLYANTNCPSQNVCNNSIDAGNIIAATSGMNTVSQACNIQPGGAAASSNKFIIIGFIIFIILFSVASMSMLMMMMK